MSKKPLACAALASLFFTSAPAAAQGAPSRPFAAPPLSGPAPAPAKGTLAEGEEALRASDYGKAKATLGAIQGDLRPAALVALARAEFETGRFAEALARAKEAEAKPAQRAAAACVRAEVLMATGKLDLAMTVLASVAKESGTASLRAKWLHGATLLAAGRRVDAEAKLMEVIDAYDQMAPTDAEGLFLVGASAHLMRSPKDANQAFNESEKANKKNVELLLARAELFLDKYDPGHAAEVAEEALALAPNRADALAMVARVKLEQALDFAAAERLVDKALAVHPTHGGALAVRAGLALRDLDIAGAEKWIKRGLDTNPRDLELLSLKATARFLSDDRGGYEAAKKQVLSLNKEYSRFYGIAAEYAEWEHRYDDIVTMMREATKVDPKDAKAWAQLGVMQMRSGDEAAGLLALKQAWALDRFNVRVFNTLNLYEKSIATDYETKTGGVFRIRYPKAERALLERYVPRMLDEAWASMKARYAFVPKEPVTVELYESREHFSVRTSGLPNVGIQGVCFGRVLASMTPRGEPFNWGNVLWHELGHVFAIELSKSHVPRWFTEGLSEYETIVRRPEWRREQDPDLAMALRRGSLPSAVDMNRAFTHAKSGADVTVAYYASSQLLVYTAETFGMDRIASALRAWGEGLVTEDVLKRAFGVTAKAYDDGFRAWLKQRLVRYEGQFMMDDRAEPLDLAKALAEKSPANADARVGYALSLLHARKLAEAKVELGAALAAAPSHMAAHFLSAKLEKEPNLREVHLRAIQKAGGDGYTVRMALAELAEMRKTPAAARNDLLAAHRFDPSQADPLRALYELAHEAKQADEELSILRKLAPLEQHDRKLWRAYLEHLVTRKAWDEARRVGEAAVFVDIASPDTHFAYGRALAAVGDSKGAIFELETAVLAGPKPPLLAQIHEALAAVHRTLGQTSEAVRHDDEAKKARAAGPPKP